MPKSAAATLSPIPARTSTAASRTPAVPSYLAPWRFCGRLLRLHAGGHSSRPDDDDPGAGPVLRRHVTVQVRAQHDDDVVRLHGGRRHRLRAVGLVDGVERRRHVLRRPVRPVRPRGRRDERLHLRHVPDDVRRDHRRADQRRDRRPGEVLGLGGVPADLGDAGLLPARPHGVQLHRLGPDLQPDRRPGLRRRHRGPHQRRRGRPGARGRRGQAPRLAQGQDAAAQPDAHDAGRGPAVGRLVRLQRRLDRLRDHLRRRTRTPSSSSSTPRPAGRSPTPRWPRWPPSSAGSSWSG